MQMLNLNKIVLMILILCLEGCGIKPLVEENLTIHIEYDASISKYVVVDCMSRTYKASLNYVGPLDQAVKVPIERCDKMLGFNPYGWSRAVSKIQYLINRYSSKKSTVDIQLP